MRVGFIMLQKDDFKEQYKFAPFGVIIKADNLFTCKIGTYAFDGSELKWNERKNV